MALGSMTKYMIRLSAKTVTCVQRNSPILQYFFVIQVEATMASILPITPVVINDACNWEPPWRKYFA